MPDTYTTTQINPLISVAGAAGVTQSFSVSSPSTITGATVSGGGSTGTSSTSWGIYLLVGALAYFGWKKVQ
jgi:hypothetical protein